MISGKLYIVSKPVGSGLSMPDPLLLATYDLPLLTTIKNIFQLKQWRCL